MELIPLTQLEADPSNVRKVVDADGIAELAASIQAHGLMQAGLGRAFWGGCKMRHGAGHAVQGGGKVRGGAAVDAKAGGGFLRDFFEGGEAGHLQGMCRVNVFRPCAEVFGERQEACVFA